MRLAELTIQLEDGGKQQLRVILGGDADAQNEFAAHVADLASFSQLVLKRIEVSHSRIYRWPIAARSGPPLARSSGSSLLPGTMPLFSVRRCSSSARCRSS